MYLNPLYLNADKKLKLINFVGEGMKTLKELDVIYFNQFTQKFKASISWCCGCKNNTFTFKIYH